MAKLTFNVDMCKGCGLCVDACPKHILEVSKVKINLVAELFLDELVCILHTGLVDVAKCNELGRFAVRGGKGVIVHSCTAANADVSKSLLCHKD